MDKLCSRLQQEYAGTGKVLCLDDVFAAWTTDAVTWYAMAMSYGCAEHPDFKAEFTDVSEGLMEAIHALTHVLWLARALSMVPPKLLAKSNAQMGALAAFYAEIDKQIRLIMEGENKGYEDVAHRTVCHELLSSKILRPDKKTPEVLSDEAQSIVLAGIETTKAIMVTACFWVLEKPEVKGKLRNELEAAIPDPSKMLSLSSLQNLPYLSAVVQAT